MTSITERTWLDELQLLITNRLDHAALRGRRLCAILGDVPSTYAKSPSLWNAAFRALQLEATYVPLDVPQDRLRAVVQTLRASEAFLGGSVTVPYKAAIIPLLDEIDPLTARIGAVNVIVRTEDGKLIGYNTDGLGGVRALTREILPGQRPPVRDLSRARVLLIGAGGAAQALAFHLWDQMPHGELVIANRTRASAEALVQRLTALRAGHLVALDEQEIGARAPSMELIINATVKGQAGIRKLASGEWLCLEPYSCLGPAHPTTLEPPASAEAFQGVWYRASASDIQENHQRSLEICARLPREAVCYDIIYAPLETTFLRHARWSGHATLNGKTMNVAQALEAFTRYVCRHWLEREHGDLAEAAREVGRAMGDAWARP